eukprot:6191794-Pleurochrysis_carterae.AAC.2
MENSSAMASLLALSLPLSPRPKPCNLDLVHGQELKVFVYSLPTAYHSAIVEYVEKVNKQRLNSRCAHLREPCPSSGFSTFENLRTHCTDVPLLYKLLQATSIVVNPAQADIFLVPFLMGCNAVLGWGKGMKRFNRQAHQKFFSDFPRFIAEYLPHFRKFPHRHLFLFPVDSMFTPRFLAKAMTSLPVDVPSNQKAASVNAFQYTVFIQAVGMPKIAEEFCLKMPACAQEPGTSQQDA